jgi:hypothetical protein
MIRAIHSLPWGWALFAYAVLGIGAFSTLAFIVRYMTNLPWRSTKEGRHLLAMTVSVSAFFVLYLVQAFVPDWPGRQYLLIVLLVSLVANCVWRWILLERHLAARRRGNVAREDA